MFIISFRYFGTTPKNVDAAQTVEQLGHVRMCNESSKNRMCWLSVGVIEGQVCESVERCIRLVGA